MPLVMPTRHPRKSINSSLLCEFPRDRHSDSGRDGAAPGIVRDRAVTVWDSNNQRQGSLLTN